MITATIPISDDAMRLNLNVQWSVTADQARRKLSTYLITEVNMFMSATRPGKLVIASADEIVWRFDVEYGSAATREMRVIGEAYVDAITGEICLNEKQIEQLIDHAKQFVASTAPVAAA